MVSSGCVGARWLEDTTRMSMDVVVWVASCVCAREVLGRCMGRSLKKGVTSEK